MPFPLGDVGRPFRGESDADRDRRIRHDPEARRGVGIEVEVRRRGETLGGLLDRLDAVDREGADLVGTMIEADHVERAAVVPDLVGVDAAGRFLARAPRPVSHFERAVLEDALVEGPDRVTKGRITLVRPGQDAEAVAEAFEVARQFRPEARADLGEGGADRIVEDGAFEGSQQIFAEGEGEQLVGREGDLAHLEGLEEAVVDLAVPLLARHGESGVHQRIEIAVDRAPHAAELFGELVESGPGAASRESLDQEPLARELVSPHGQERTDSTAPRHPERARIPRRASGDGLLSPRP